MLAGRLTGTLDGRPVVIDADDGGVVVQVAALRTAWAARKIAFPLMPILHWLRRARVPLRVRVAGVLSVELLPETSAAATFLVPVLRRLR